MGVPTQGWGGGGGGGGHQSIVWKNYCRKLHENEVGSRVGFGSSLAPHLDPRLQKSLQCRRIREKCILALVHV